MQQQSNDFITRTELRAELDATEKNIHDHLTQITEHISNLANRLERAETTLLSGFRNYARSEGVRTKALEVRVHELERRMLDVETHTPSSPDDEPEQ